MQIVDTKYRCTACGLKIKIGWRWGGFTRSKDPLKIIRAMKKRSERTYLICKECGAQYMIVLTGQWRKCAYMHPVKPHGLPLPDSLFWYNCDEWHEINPIETKYNQIVLSKQPCQNCLTVGKIGSDIRTGDACPHCKEKTLKDLTEYFLINPIRFK
jgi:hypothetical protein